MIRVTHLIIGDCALEIGDQRVTPAAPHLFAMLLILGLANGRRHTRPQLQSQLFQGDRGSGNDAHSVRQLLYRLRQLGLAFDEQAHGLRLSEQQTSSPLDALSRLTPQERAALPRDSFQVLPGYAPALPAPFLHWLEDLQSSLRARLRDLLAADLATLYASHSWASVLRTTEVLLDLDEGNVRIVEARSHAFAMLGRHPEALALVDACIEDCPTADALPFLRALKVRLSRAPSARREAMLRGRGEQLAHLESLWGDIAHTGAHRTALVGHSGIGKTRLAQEFAARVVLSGGHVLSYACDSHSHYQPFALFAHVLPDLLRMRGSIGAAPESLRVLERLRPEAYADLSLTLGTTAIEQLRSSIHRALLDLFDAVCAEKPLLLVVDDAHLLDAASVFVLRALTSGRASAHVHVVACLRPSTNDASLLTPGKRHSALELHPLSSTDSRALLLDLRSDYASDASRLEWCLSQAAGNPFYLHTLATRHESAPSVLPLDIHSLARTAYSSLDTDTRSLLDACLLLGRFATLERIALVACVDDKAMLGGLRSLEDHDLAHYADGCVRGPHALLHEALKALIPTTVAAVLHSRIASNLEAECEAEGYSPGLALASAQSWLAVDRSGSAVALLRRCAAHAASLGEPQTAADLLGQLARTHLPNDEKAPLLEELVRYADMGGDRELVSRVLRERLQLATEAGEPLATVKDLELQIVEAEIYFSKHPADVGATLTDLLTNEEVPASIRVRAGIRLLVVADIEFDRALAERVYSAIAGIRESLGAHCSALLRADLVYQTTFGSIAIATGLAERLLTSTSDASTTSEAVNGRHYSAYAFYRLRDVARAGHICEQTYAFTHRHGILSGALYSASLRTAIALTAGHFDDAYAWFAKSEAVARGIPPEHLSPTSGFDANAGSIAMRELRFEEAKAHFAAPVGTLAFLSSARYRAVRLSMSLRVKQLQGRHADTAAEVEELHELYLCGRDMGGQDCVVEALWCAAVLNDDPSQASTLLKDYLSKYRREQSLPDWSLRNSTSADEAWL